MNEIKDDTIDGEIYHALGLEESILWKWLYYPKQSIDSKIVLNQYNLYQINNGIFHRDLAKKFTICMEIQKTLNSNLGKEKWS